MIRMNLDRLVETSALVEVHNRHTAGVYDISAEGKPYAVPFMGGINYNVRVGDSAYWWVADHIEPGVTTANPDNETNISLNNLVCIGNRARVVSGDAKGAKGIVVGKHGGVEHVILDFEPDIREKLVYGDKIMICLLGRGLVFEDYPAIKTLGIAPELVRAMMLRDGPDGKLIVPVAAQVPSLLMGAGLG
ncbi:MAG: DUF4438 domain-containing protein, partial [Anaerolineales bacterium]|nr:DUF4438 domain-containing protein [Anaerolineales bacterium]